jgi:hypothetical protein
LTWDSLRSKLVNRASQTTESVAAIDEWDLRQDDQRQQNDDDFSASHFAEDA